MNSFYQLEPQIVLQSVENAGFEPTGRLIQLNSYENRVFQIDLEDRDPLIAKFYRPNRWSKPCILEEHEFLFDLKKEDLPVVAPLLLADGSSLGETHDMYFAFFEKAKAKMPDELFPQDYKKIGRMLAHLHNIGSRKKFSHRPTLNTEQFGYQNLDVLQHWVAPELWPRYEEAAENILQFLEDQMENLTYLRIHGDCHRGNLLQNDSGFFMVDFDDSCTGPAVQDFWMLFTGDDESLTQEEDLMLEGYTELRKFDEKEFDLVNGLRGLRIMHYAAWIARRWTDPSFERLFPNFNTHTYWAEEVEALEKIAWR